MTLSIYSAVLDGRADDLAAMLDTLHEQGQRTVREKPIGTGLARRRR